MTAELVAEPAAGPVLEATDLRKTFRSKALFKPALVVQAVAGVSLQVNRHETLGIVGESGSGKSTLGRLLVGLIAPDSGTIALNGEAVPTKGRNELARFRSQVQMVFQDPFSSLDPHKRVDYTLAEPLVVQNIGDKDSRRERVAWLMDMVGLGKHLLDRFPAELSGGQRQRIAVARALAVNPSVVVCDEPVSALDVSTQAQVVNLFKDLQDELGIALIFITHDISVVRNISHRVTVMHKGVLVETGPTEQVISDPQDPYTQKLISAVPGQRLMASMGHHPLPD